MSSPGDDKWRILQPVQIELKILSTEFWREKNFFTDIFLPQDLSGWECP